MKASQNHLPSLFSTIIFVIGALFSFGIALLMGFAALASLVRGTEVKVEQTIFLVTFGFEGLVLLAAAFFSFQKYLRKPAADHAMFLPVSNWLIAIFISVAIGSVSIGYVISTTKTFDWLVLPFLTIPVIVLPLAVLLAVGTKKLSFGARWQTWDALGLAMTVTPLVLFALEILIAIVIFIFAIMYVMSQPTLASRLQAIAQRIMILGPQSKEAIDLLSPFLTKPGVIITALTYIAILVPAVEEIFKPLGVWFFAGRLESQAQGFALGALGGAGYALIETVGVTGQTTDWAGLLLSRIGTGLLHITTSALMGAAIVLAWRQRRYLRLVGTYLLAVLLHGLWNATAILFTFLELTRTLHQAGRLGSLQPALVVTMLALATGLFAILVIANRKMQRTLASPPAQVATPGENKDVSKTI